MESHAVASCVDETLTFRCRGNHVHLGIRQVKKDSQVLSVKCCLVQYLNEVAVGKKRLTSGGLEKVLHVLCDTGRNATVLSRSLPDGCKS